MNKEGMILLGAAGAAAAWWFFFRKDPMTSMPSAAQLAAMQRMPSAADVAMMNAPGLPMMAGYHRR